MVRQAKPGLVTVTALCTRAVESRIGLRFVLSFHFVSPSGGFTAAQLIYRAPTHIIFDCVTTVGHRRMCPCIDAWALALGVPSKHHLRDHGVALFPLHVLGLALTG